MPFFSANARPSGSGTQVPDTHQRNAVQLKTMPRTLVFAISSLDLLMHAFLYFSFQYPCPCGFVESSNFQDVCGIYPVVRSAPHDMIPEYVKLVDRNLQTRLEVRWWDCQRCLHCCMWPSK